MRKPSKWIAACAAIAVAVLSSAVVPQQLVETLQAARALREDAEQLRGADRIDDACAALEEALSKLAAVERADTTFEILLERWACGGAADLLGPSPRCVEVARAAWSGVVVYYGALLSLRPEDFDSQQYARGRLARALEGLGRRGEALGVQDQIVASLARALDEDETPTQEARETRARLLLAARQERARLLLAEGRVDDGIAAIRGVAIDAGQEAEHVDAFARAWAVERLAEAGRLEDALALQRRILARTRETSGEDAEETLQVRERIAVTLGRMSRFDEAFAEFEELMGLWQSHHPGAIGLHNVQENYANLLVDQGVTWVQRMRPLYRAALAGYEAGHAEGKVDAATVETCRWELAQAEQYFGRYVEAKELAQRALDTMSADPELGPDHPDTTWARGVLGIIAERLGDNEGARHYFERNLEIRRRLLPPRHPAVLIAMRHVGMTLRRLGGRDNLENAERLLRASVEGFEAQPEPILRELTSSWSWLSWVLIELGRNDEAIELMRRAVRIADEVAPAVAAAEDHAELAHALAADGKADEALDEYARSLPLLRPFYEYRSYSLFAREYCLLLAHAGRREELSQHLGDLLDFSREHFDECVCLPPRQSIELARMIDENAEFVLDLGRKAAGPDREGFRRGAFELLESLRGVSLFSARVFARVGDDPEIARLRQGAVKASAELRQIVLDRDHGSADGAGDVLEKARQKERDQFRALRAAVAKSGSRLPDITVEALGKALAEDEAIVAFRRVHRWEWEGGIVKTAPRLLAHLVLRGGKLDEIDLGDAAEIDSLARSWHDAILGGDGRSDGGRKEPPDDQLRRQVLEKVFSRLRQLGLREGALHICLDGELHRVPLETTRSSRDAYTFVYEPSLTRLVDPPPKVDSARSLLLVGEVDYDAAVAGSGAPAGGSDAAGPPSERGGDRAQWETLDNSGAEIDAVRKRFKGGKVQELRGKDATVQRFREAVAGSRFILVATHGAYRSRDALDPMDLDAPATGPVDTIVRGFAPMTLCYLVFAGANHDRGALLTAEEIAQLDLSGCELAVLSACSSSEGQLAPGHGVQSLQTALHTAGARSVITTRWEVKDKWARDLIDAFFAELWGKKATSKAAALEAARLAMQRRKVPFMYWAAFVLTGDPN